MPALFALLHQILNLVMPVPQVVLPVLAKPCKTSAILNPADAIIIL